MIACVEAYGAAVAQMAEHYPEHWAALALDRDKPEAALAPDWDRYRELDAAGKLMLVTLRERGALVGYMLGIVAPGLHYTRCLTYTMDIYWVTPAVRGRHGGSRLVRATLAECRRRGVKRVVMGSKNHAATGRLFEAHGFRPIETYYSIWLGD